MAKKKPSKTVRPPTVSRKSNGSRCQRTWRYACAVWSKVGHLLEWCSSVSSWIKLFCTEARPYRETYYWEAIAQLVSSYLANHKGASAEKALTDCLIATQCPPSADDTHMIVHFRQEWGNILNRSRRDRSVPAGRLGPGKPGGPPTSSPLCMPADRRHGIKVTADSPGRQKKEADRKSTGRRRRYSSPFLSPSSGRVEIYLGTVSLMWFSVRSGELFIRRS